MYDYYGHDAVAISSYDLYNNLEINAFIRQCDANNNTFNMESISGSSI